ncbi:MAG: outer membrane beta-barrel protein [Saprospiraceae bacterium]
MKWALGGKLGYESRGYKFNDTVLEKGEIRYNNISISPYGIFQINDRLSVEAGASYLINIDQKLRIGDEQWQEPVIDLHNKAYLSLLANVAYSFNRFQVFAGFDYGITPYLKVQATDINGEPIGDVGLFFHNIKIGVGYRLF